MGLRAVKTRVTFNPRGRLPSTKVPSTKELRQDYAKIFDEVALEYKPGMGKCGLFNRNDD